MKTEPNLGGSPPEDARRDAVHIAVYPAVAGEELTPGVRVSLRGGRAYWSGNPTGVVDPFLPPRVKVEPGQRFWLFIFPQTVTNVRHAWEHPAFPEVP